MCDEVFQGQMSAFLNQVRIFKVLQGRASVFRSASRSNEAVSMCFKTRWVCFKEFQDQMSVSISDEGLSRVF